MDTIYVGTSPCDERCAQTSVTPNYLELQRIECRAYITALTRKYGAPPEGASLRTKTSPHDFGSYAEVVCIYDPNIDAAYDYASKVENGLQTWSEAGMWGPLKYDDKGVPIHRIEDPDLWIVEANPGCLPRKI